MKVVAFITIKMNSVRLPHKNILPLGAHPLSWHICNTLLRCETIDEIYIYCSDEEIMKYVPQDDRLIFLRREKWLDGDNIRAQDTYTAFTNDVDADIYVAALTTAPFITKNSLDTAVSMVKNEGYDSAFAAKKLQTFAWYKGEPLNYDPALIPRTQDIEPIIVETSGFFVFKKEIWKQHKRRIGFNPYIKYIDDIEAVDIDTEEDFKFAEKLISLKN
ncbi:MAG: acylneuraminate cytidylyltransferase family protein [Muribaculum sp.]|nr:acylneuraminate cytidylyltransferase family protein [Muribaculum sp.]